MRTSCAKPISERCESPYNFAALLFQIRGPLTSPNFQVHGNAHLRHTTANAARCLEAFGAPAKILVYPGAAKPLVGQPHPAVDIHGSDGLGGVEGLPSPTDPAVAARIVGIDERAGGLLPALQGMRDASLAAIRKGTKLHLAVTGAFTNAALFFSIYPELAKQAIQEVVLMGGGVGIGNSKLSSWGTRQRLIARSPTLVTPLAGEELVPCTLSR